MATTLESTITRTFKQLGLGYDVVPGTTGVIAVSLDGQVIYYGPDKIVTKDADGENTVMKKSY